MSQAATYEDALSLIGQPAQRQALDVGGSLRGSPQQLDPAKVRVAQSQEDADARAGRERAMEEAFIAQNSADGVPLDVRSGMGAGLRAKLSFDRNVDNQAKSLAKEPGVMAVRKSTSGGLIARMLGPDGKPVDVLVNERGATMRDMAGMASDAIPAAAGLGAAVLTQGLSLLPQAAFTAGAAAAAGGTQDAVVRKAQGNAMDPGEIAVARGIGMAADMAIPLGLGYGKRLAQFAVGTSPFAGPLEAEAGAAAARLSQASGANLSLSAAQASGNPLLARAEAFASKLPGGNPLNKQAAQQDEALRAIQKYIIGADPAAVPGEQELADRIGGVVAKERDMATKAITADAVTGQNLVQADITNLLNSGTVPRNVTPTQAGGAVRAKVVAIRDQFKTTAEQLYNDVYVKAGGNDVVVPTKAVQDAIAEIRKNSPEAASVLAPELNRVFAVGKALTQEVTTPNGVTEVPKSIGLRQARELRSLLGDMIDSNLPTSTVPQRYLVELRKAVGKSIDDGVRAAPNPDVGSALQKANSYYRDNVEKFHQLGVSELFKDPNMAGGIGDSQVVRRIFAGEGDVEGLRRYRALLGPASTEYKAIVRAGLNEVVENASLGERFVQGDKLLASLRSWKNAEFRKEVLGPMERDLVANADLLRVAQGAKLSVDDVERVLAAKPGQAADTMRNMITKQQTLDQWYKSKVVADLTDGKLSPATFNADEFVSRFVQNASAKEARQVMTQLRQVDPTLPDMVQRRTMLNLLQRVEREATPDEAVSNQLGRVSYEKIQRFVNGPDAEKYTAFLGKPAMDNLKDLMMVEAARRKSQNAAGAAGSLVTSNILASLMEFTPSEIPRILKNRAMAGILVSPATRALATGVITIPASPKSRLAAMASPPVIRALVEEFQKEPDQLGQVLDAIHMSPDANKARQQRNGYNDALDLLRSP